MDVVLQDETLRDGLQDEDRLLSLTEKLEFVGMLADAGVRRMQLGSFVQTRTMPQMANTDALVSLVSQKYPELLCAAQVLNEKGLDRAVHSGLAHVSMSISVSDSHNSGHAGRPAAEALGTMSALVARAVAAGMRVRAGVQYAFGCGEDGAVVQATVLDAVGRLADAGATEINLADTYGMAHPSQIRQMVAAVRKASPATEISLHLHDTCGLGLVNMYAGYEAGVRFFDVAVGGLGGCPFLPGAAGNVAAEDAAHLFQGMGVDTGIDLHLLCRAVDYLEALLGRRLPGRMNQVLNVQHR